MVSTNPPPVWATLAQAFLLYMKNKYPDFKIKMRNETRIFRHGEINADGTFKYPWALGNPDRLININGQDGGLEIKRTTRKGAIGIKNIKDWTNGIVPIYYELQCRYYMAIFNLQYWVICCAWGMELDEMSAVIIFRDYDIEDAMMAGIEKFAYHCQNKIEPPIGNCKPAIINEYYSRLYGKVSESKPAVVIPDEYAAVIQKALIIDDEIKEKEAALKEAEEKREEIYKALYPLYKDSAYGYYKYDNGTMVSVKLKTPMKRAALDTDKLKTEQPNIYEKYTTVFDATKFKRDQAQLAKKYMLPARPNFDGKSKNSFELTVKEKKEEGKNSLIQQKGNAFICRGIGVILT